MRLPSAWRRSSPHRRTALLLFPLLLQVLLFLMHTSEARHLRSARLSTAAAASLGMPSSSAAAKGSSTTTTNSNKPPTTLLFTLQADSAFLQLGDPGDQDPDLGKLTLGGVAPTAVWFSERPDRRAGALPTATLASEALDVAVDDDNDELSAAGDDASSPPRPRPKPTWLGVPNVALTGTSEGGGTVSFLCFKEEKKKPTEEVK